MSAPDHLPYLVDGDLRTPEDVLRFQGEILDKFDGWVEPLDLIDAARERLDRERRQACRRAVKDLWRKACAYREAERDDYPGRRPEAKNIARRLRIASIRRALAFRAAARQP